MELYDPFGLVQVNLGREMKADSHETTRLVSLRIQNITNGGW